MVQYLNLCALCVLLFVSLSHAQSVPQLISYQGRLTDTNGVPPDTGDYALTAGIYSGASAATPLWSETHVSVPVVRGYFNLVLGGLSSGIEQALAYTNLHVQVVAPDGMTTGRQKLLSVPYALNGTPAGVIDAFGGQTNRVPRGWLLCDGRAASSSNYPALFYAIGTSWGDGSKHPDDSSSSGTDFNLPDLRGVFLRGLDLGLGRDPDSAARVASGVGGSTDAVGSYQGDEFETHSHGIAFRWEDTFREGNLSTMKAGADVTKDTEPAGEATETRPKNMAVNYIIKY